jgi:hypothetical protein
VSQAYYLAVAAQAAEDCRILLAEFQLQICLTPQKSKADPAVANFLLQRGGGRVANRYVSLVNKYHNSLNQLGVNHG